MTSHAWLDYDDDVPLISMRSTIPLTDRWSMRILNDEEYYQIVEDGMRGKRET